MHVVVLSRIQYDQAGTYMRIKDISKQGTSQSEFNMSAKAAPAPILDSSSDSDDMIQESQQEKIEELGLGPNPNPNPKRGEKRRRVLERELSPESQEEYVNVPSLYIPLLLECLSHPPSILRSSIPSEEDDLLVLDFVTDLIEGKKKSPSRRASVVFTEEIQDGFDGIPSDYSVSKFSLIPFQKTSYEETDFSLNNSVWIKSRFFTDKIRSSINTSVQSYLIHLNFDETKELHNIIPESIINSDYSLVIRLTNSETGDLMYHDIEELKPPDAKERAKIVLEKDEKLKDVLSIDYGDLGDRLLMWYTTTKGGTFMTKKNKVRDDVHVYLYNRFKNSDFTKFQTASIFTYFLGKIRSFGANLSLSDGTNEDEKSLQVTIDLYHKIGRKATLLAPQALNQLLLQQPTEQEAVREAFGLYSFYKAAEMVHLYDSASTLSDVQNYIAEANIPS